MKEKYNQWNLDDSLTLEEKRVQLRRYLSKIYRREIKENEVNRCLSQLEHKQRTGLIR